MHDKENGLHLCMPWLGFDWYVQRARPIVVVIVIIERREKHTHTQVWAPVAVDDLVHSSSLSLISSMIIMWLWQGHDKAIATNQQTNKWTNKRLPMYHIYMVVASTPCQVAFKMPFLFLSFFLGWWVSLASCSCYLAHQLPKTHKNLPFNDTIAPGTDLCCCCCCCCWWWCSCGVHPISQACTSFNLPLLLSWPSSLLLSFTRMLLANNNSLVCCYLSSSSSLSLL